MDIQYKVVVPAAGAGKRMQADRPKQYLTIAGKTILEHTLERLISHPAVGHIVLALDPQDPYFPTLPIANADWLTRVDGGQERADSVLAGLAEVEDDHWVLVHDAARPCLSHTDLDRLLELQSTSDHGGILATPVRDTMKRASDTQPQRISHTEERTHLWHAQTPQFFPCGQLKRALSQALDEGVAITDEASAIEWHGGDVTLVAGSENNLKVTRPDDLALAEFFLTHRTA